MCVDLFILVVVVVEGARFAKIYLIFGRRAARDIGGEEGGQWMTRSPENLLLSLMIMLR